MYASALASDPVEGWEVGKAIYLPLPRALCSPPPPSCRRDSGPRVLGACVSGSLVQSSCPALRA